MERGLTQDALHGDHLPHVRATHTAHYRGISNVCPAREAGAAGSLRALIQEPPGLANFSRRSSMRSVRRVALFVVLGVPLCDLLSPSGCSSDEDNGGSGNTTTTQSTGSNTTGSGGATGGAAGAGVGATGGGTGTTGSGGMNIGQCQSHIY